MCKRVFWLFLIPALACATGKKTYGWLEKVTLGKDSLVLTAKLDTGANTSALDASNIRIVTQNGQTYVKFTVEDNRSGRKLVLTKPLLRFVKIKLRTWGKLPRTARRPVVVMPLCLDGTVKDIQVDLTRRNHFHYPLLLGRRAIARFDGLVDPSRTFISRTRCFRAD